MGPLRRSTSLNRCLAAGVSVKSMGSSLHRARTVCKPRNVLEQPMAKRSFLGTLKNGAPWSFCLLLLLDGCCYFLVGCGWLLLFPGVL